MKEQDCLRRFIFEKLGVRGEWVHLRESLQQVKQFQTLANDAVDSQLGQALAAVVLLSATVKFQGSMILQVQGDGDLRALVAQSTNERKIRGLVRSANRVSGSNLKEMMGAGHLVLTIESEISEPYQGIVPLEEDSLAAMLHTYFMQSEQLATRLWLFANKTEAVGLLIQELPDQKHYQSDWERIEMLADTVTEEEMLRLDSEEMLYRLFNEEKVRIYEPESVTFQCNCSRQKISGTLLALGREELEAIFKERDDIEVDCQFCGEKYRFDKVDVENILLNQAMGKEGADTQH
ncbi:Hsp33 family molecular chaperone HslO [Methylomarinum sp. Ch1-1]|uniref:Hsp33 family molecular chaperone HslO n=1 Tax=Methylomarinum roseum TaxID=3067653 RepID=A0AAU7NZ14_9GAMM|nr:Hsp33 family molecular chaperone HslO [Methylomarinum sp. Ch1-1]MDP4521654.1 Hsp33 family molecular chaperone HslO [Methylomarinum sp. Ch1-1]